MDRNINILEARSMKLFGIFLLLVGMSAAALATPSAVPEIDPGSVVSALALISGSLLLIKGRRKT